MAVPPLVALLHETVAPPTIPLAVTDAGKPGTEIASTGEDAGEAGPMPRLLKALTRNE